MLAGVLLSLTAVLPLSNFLVNVVTSRGGTDADLGLAMFVMGAFELPTAFLFPRLLHRFGSGRLLVLSAVFGTLKAVALLCTFNYAGVLLAQPLQLLATACSPRRRSTLSMSPCPRLTGCGARR